MRLFDMNRMRWTTGALLILGLLLAACGGKGKKAADQTIEAIRKNEGLPVRVEPVRRMALSALEAVGGTVEGYEQATVNSMVPGRITEIKADVGARVKAGQEILRITPDGASQLETAKAQFDMAAKSKERVAAIAKEGGVSQEVQDQVETGYIAATEAYKGARSSEIVTAPFDGVVTQIYQPVNTQFDRNKPLLDVAILDRVRMRLNVSEAIIARFHEGQRAFVVTTEGDTVFGKVSLVSLTGSALSHTFTVETVFSNPGMKLKPGAYVTVYTAVENRATALSVPMEAVVAEGATHSVWVIEGGTSRKALIRLGIRGGERFEVLEGLADGAVIVVAGGSLLSDGAKVKVVE
ncbi:MAG: hypothetical protein A2293_16230 [Elusimicrobia bacterium RIFOXYB2_FULL_49_7]|nr:MAG: hypothetical protein A2293_16230 [Elusimicrobia bacterium RIFOXYB2_FULL_49_7]